MRTPRKPTHTVHKTHMVRAGIKQYQSAVPLSHRGPYDVMEDT